MKHVVLALLLLISASVIRAQSDGKPNFSGAWERATKNVDLPKIPGVKYKPFLRLEIDHVGNVFTITTIERIESYDRTGKMLGSTQKVLTKTAHYTDKSGETNRVPPDTDHVSKTRWDGDEIVVETYVKEKATFRYEYRYDLSKDGTKLAVTYSLDRMMPNVGKPFSGTRTFLKVS